MSLAERFRAIRSFTETLCAGLETEDYVIQASQEASPVKWHLAHTTWFFERFVLREFAPGYIDVDPAYGYLFNSYYETVGPFHERPRRGTLSRPTVREVYLYRRSVTEAVYELLKEADASASSDNALGSRIELGLQHEQQHQELILMDIKAAFWANPLRPALYHVASRSKQRSAATAAHPRTTRWADFAEGVVALGHEGDGFAFDNEKPLHRVLVGRHRLGSRLVTNGEYLEFIDGGGYRRPELWLSEGWSAVKAREWSAPQYWERDGASWWIMTLFGMQRLDESEPVAHVSYYEADAFARWRGVRLPSEAEWERAAKGTEVRGNLLESALLHVAPAAGRDGLEQLYGDLWEWTQSPYASYPGFKPLEGSLGEYNAKFMCNQHVLRGGSFATPLSHVRASYRNYFPPDARWQFSGLRLASDLIS